MYFMYSLFLIFHALRRQKKSPLMREKLVRKPAFKFLLRNIPAHAGKKGRASLLLPAELCTSSHVTFTTFGWLPLPYSVHKQYIRFRCCQTTTTFIARISETLNAGTALLSSSLLPVRFSETGKLSDKFQICKEG